MQSSVYNTALQVGRSVFIPGLGGDRGVATPYMLTSYPGLHRWQFHTMDFLAYLFVWTSQFLFFVFFIKKAMVLVNGKYW